MTFGGTALPGKEGSTSSAKAEATRASTKTALFMVRGIEGDFSRSTSESLIIFKECIAMWIDKRENAKILCCDTGKEEIWGNFRMFYTSILRL